MLDGVRVLSAETHITAPKATQILRDLGAEVIKVENTDHGGDYRYLWQTADQPDDLSYPWYMFNRGKKSIGLDLSSPDGQEIFRAIASDCDVVIENWGLGRMSKFNLAYSDIKAINEDIVYESVTGFGQTGPLREYNALDWVVQAMSGLANYNGQVHDMHMLSPIVIADELTGIYAAMSCLAGLVNKFTSGDGTYIDVSMLDTLVSLYDLEMADHVENPDAAVTSAYNRLPHVVTDVYETETGPIVVFVEPHEWAAFAEKLGLEELIPEGEYASLIDDPDGRERAREAIAEVLQTESREYWLTELRDKMEMFVAPALTVKEAFDQDQVRRERGVVNEGADDRIGEYSYLRYPNAFPGNELDPPESAPHHGEHTTELLGGFGYSESEIERLAETGVVFQAPGSGESR